jgi:uncharacterized protein YjbJ (UPF0337 family)
MNRDELEGKKEQFKGKVKQAAGDLTDDDQLHDEGVADEAAGDVQEGFGRARRKVGKAIEDLGDSIKR